ncbi:MAG TPA: cytochrome c biogenesis protein CcsA [Burkholderiaceae bacterium]|nr:cytochrome c biogenesis protein CcsA [Burkholderiaceae bacterium]
MNAAAFPALLTAVSLMALLSYAVAAAVAERAPGGLRWFLLAGWLLHAAAIGIDTTGIGTQVQGARFGFAPALSVTLWLVISVYVAESRSVPISGVRRALALLGAIAVLLALMFPGELRPHAASRWAPIHWVLGIASYGLFGAAVLHAAMLNRADRQMRLNLQPARLVGAGAPSSAAPPTGLPLMRLERLTFRFVSAGFVVLSMAIFLGWLFASPWRWDHKVVFSILGWLVYAGLLAGRRRFGWRGPQATRWVYTGAVLLLLAYVGSRFVMEVLLNRPLGV